jgi:hypothetical protein
MQLCQLVRKAPASVSGSTCNRSLSDEGCFPFFRIGRVDGFELAAIDGNAGTRQQAHFSAKGNKLGAHLADRRPIILAKIGNRLG